MCEKCSRESLLHTRSRTTKEERCYSTKDVVPEGLAEANEASYELTCTQSSPVVFAIGEAVVILVVSVLDVMSLGSTISVCKATAIRRLAFSGSISSKVSH